MTKKHKLSYEIAKTLIIFGVLVIVLLVIFQLFLLEPMYKSSVLNQITTIAKDINEEISANDISYLDRQPNIPYEDEDFNKFLFHKERETGSCISIYSYSNDNNLALVDGDPNGCIAFKIGKNDIADQIIESSKTKEAVIRVSKENIDHIRVSNKVDIITYVSPVTSLDDIYILIQTGVSPLNATIKTLANQLLLITILMAIAIIILAYLLNRKIAKPLSLINDNAKALSHGEYVVMPTTNKYIEAEELNETLANAAVNIKIADKAKRDLIANISHDLRTPLTMITGYGEMMQDIPEENNSENIQVIVDESKRLTRLVNDLLDLSKLQDNIIELNKTRFNLTELLKQEIAKYEVYVIKEGYKIEAFLGEDVYINADKARIEQVFNNFMVNAVHYDTNNKHIIIREIIDDDNVQVQVIDHGKGIEEKDINNIWDRYFKVDKKHMRNVSGSGIGLSIVKEVLELHKAKYGVSSEVDKGSTFWFSFPIEK